MPNIEFDKVLLNPHAQDPIEKSLVPHFWTHIYQGTFRRTGEAISSVASALVILHTHNKPAMGDESAFGKVTEVEELSVDNLNQSGYVVTYMRGEATKHN